MRESPSGWKPDPRSELRPSRASKFFLAGAASAVASLWDVDDRSTPLLMEVFYRELAAGKAAPEAMLATRRRLYAETGEAKLVFRTRPLAHAHPRFWASFIVLASPWDILGPSELQPSEPQTSR